MAVYTGPKYGNTDFDASRWRDFYGNVFSTGVVKGARIQAAAGGDLAVSATTGLGWSVATGEAVIKGFSCVVDTAAVTGTLSAADPSFPRIDTIVLSWAYNSGSGTLSVTQVTGTPASSPVAPTLTQNDTTYQFPLADCLVNAGATTIASVTDRRVYCLPTNAAALTGAAFTGAISGTSAAFSAGVTANVTGNATGITSDNALTTTTHVTGTAPNQFYLMVMPASGTNKMAFGTRVYDGAATHDVVVVNSDGSSSIASYDGGSATIRAIRIFIGTVDPATYTTVNEGDLWIRA